MKKRAGFLSISRAAAAMAAIMALGPGFAASCATAAHPALILEASWPESGKLALLDRYPVHTYVFDRDYGLDELLSRGAKSDQDVIEHIKAFFHVKLSSCEKFLPEGKACTGFSAACPEGGYLHGHNEDWEKSEYLLMRSRPAKGYASVSIVESSYFHEFAQGDQRPMLAAPFFPLAGMNEKGLAVSTYSVPSHEGSQDPAKKYLIWPLAIRLVLDRAATLDEALGLLDEYNIVIEQDNSLQFFISDASGNSAIVAWIGKAMRSTRKSGSWQAVANFIQYGIAEEKFSGQGIERYARAKRVLAEKSGRISKEEGMLILAQTAQAGGTQLSVLFDLGRRELLICFGGRYEKLYHLRCVD